MTLVTSTASVTQNLKAMGDKKYLIIYHEEDNDGVCSGALAKSYLVTSLNVAEEQIFLFPATYAKMDKLEKNGFKVRIDGVFNTASNVSDNDEEQVVWIVDALSWFDNIILTDISFNNFGAIEKLYKKLGSNFIWVDHHAPVIQESIKRGFDEKIVGIRDTSRSAILNMYKYLYDPFDVEYLEGKVPLSLRYLSAWDSWSYEREGLDFEKCRTFNIGMTKIGKLDINWWYKNLTNIYAGLCGDEAFKVGQMWVDDFNEHWKRVMAKNAQGGFTIGGRSAILVFSDSATSSLCFDSVKDQYQNGICVKTSSDGNIIISLYNTDNQKDFHCGEYLKEHYNGGGHAGAAGGKMTFEEFAEHYKTKTF